MEEEKIIKIIDKTFEKIKNEQNTSNALDFINSIKEHLENKYII